MAEINLGNDTTINTTLSNVETVQANVSTEESLSANIPDINYIPGYVVAEQERRANEIVRQSNEADRIALYEDMEYKLASGYFKGDKGDPGDDATINGNNTLTITTSGVITGTQSGSTYTIGADLSNYATKDDVKVEFSGETYDTNQEWANVLIGEVSNAFEDVWGEIGKKYAKPSSGIPKTDLASNVQTSLDKADSAIQDVSNKQDVIDSSHKLSADLVDDTSTTNKFVTSSDITTWNGKSVVSGTNDGTNWSTITIDGTTKSIPTPITVDSALSTTSTNPVQNSALYKAVVGKEVTVTLYSTEWSEPSGGYFYNTVNIATLPAGTFTDNCTLELLNYEGFQYFAKHGFVLYGYEVSSQRIWITAHDKPTDTVYLKMMVYNYE